MIIYYDENDLVSFGNYMLSEARKKSIVENPEITNAPTRKMLLAAVTTFDMQNWHRLKVEAERRLQMEEAEEQEFNQNPETLGSESPQEDEGQQNPNHQTELFSDELPTDEEGNTIQLNPENWVDATKSEEE